MRRLVERWSSMRRVRWGRALFAIYQPWYKEVIDVKTKDIVSNSPSH
jgi:hypothetical protein